MINISSTSLLVYESDKNAYVCLESDELHRELCDSFEQCSIGATWMVDCILQVLPEKLRASRDAGKHLTKSDVRMLLASALEASGFPDVSRCFIAKDANASKVMAEENHCVKKATSTLAWTPQSLTSSVRYIPSDQWCLVLTETMRRFLSNRVIVLQSVSDVLPLAVVQCRLGRLWDIPGETPLDEDDFISSLATISSAVVECLSQMRNRIEREWSGIQQGTPAVRFVDFGMLTQLLGVKKSRAMRQKTENRLKEKIVELFENHDFKIKAQFG